jgi:hypothetical protein
MVTIRAEQAAVFSKNAMVRFEDEMVEHLKGNFPLQTSRSTDAELRSMIQIGIRKAAGYAVTLEEDVRVYLDCMVEFGVAFDEDRSLSWAGQTLRTRSLTGTEKMKYVLQFAGQERTERA